MKSMPQIQKFMTAMPHTIGADISLKKAGEMMKEFRIRHLPVLEAGKLVGILTERDLAVASGFDGALAGRVDDVMMPSTYTAKPEATLDSVVNAMAENKYGCCVIQQPNDKVVGIFTAVDALRVLGEVLHEHYKGRD